jgi:Ca2+-binding RTX toxin-like protein
MTSANTGDDRPVDMRLIDIGSLANGTLVVATTTTIRLQHPDGSYNEFQGAFTYNNQGELTGGTAHYINFVQNGTITYEVSDFSMSLQAIVNYAAADNTPGFFNALFSGTDNFNGSPFGDFLFALSGNDTMNGQGGNDTMSGDAGNDWLDAGAGDDSLTGGAGNDTLLGGTGVAAADSMDGGAGNDMYTVDDAGDQITEAAGAAGGIDTVISSLATLRSAALSRIWS